ncbi:MAG: methyl-accepting chemotaxis protein, partial [Poseidonibacter sp.]
MKNISIKMKLIASFSIIVILVMLLAGYSNYGMTKIGHGFTDYRQMAKGSVLAGRVQAHMLMVRMNVKDYLKTMSEKDINQFNEYYKETEEFIDIAIKEITAPQRAI